MLSHLWVSFLCLVCAPVVAPVYWIQPQKHHCHHRRCRSRFSFSQKKRGAMKFSRVQMSKAFWRTFLLFYFIKRERKKKDDSHWLAKLFIWLLVPSLFPPLTHSSGVEETEKSFVFAVCSLFFQDLPFLFCCLPFNYDPTAVKWIKAQAPLFFFFFL